MIRRFRSAIRSFAFLIGTSALAACHEDPTAGVYGRWEDSPARAARDGGAISDAATSVDAAGRLICTPSFAGGALAAWSQRTAPAFPDRRTDEPATGDDTDDDDDEKYLIQDPSCRSGWRWIGRDHESVFMKPGSDCLGCHSKRSYKAGEADSYDTDDDDEAPPFALAGTVYGALTERDDCLGKAAAVVRITDAAGQRIELPTNRAGNFYLTSKKARIALPFTAEVVFEGRRRAMMSPQCQTSCNACHTATGQRGAPGRIVTP